MHDRDKKRFRDLMMVVAVDKRFQNMLDDATLRIMFEAMKADVSIDDLERVGPELMKNSRFFPRTDEWLDAVANLPAASVAGLLPPVGKHEQTGVPKYCEKCNDSGWVLVNDENPARAVKCDCRPNNPALGAGQRKKRRSEG